MSRIQSLFDLLETENPIIIREILANVMDFRYL